jgi:hypothetical protein
MIDDRASFTELCARCPYLKSSMQISNRLRRGCVVVLLAWCIGIGASAALAIEAFQRGWIAPPSSAVIVDLGPIWIGDRCRKMQQEGILIGCFASYTVAVNVKGSLRSYVIVQQPRRATSSSYSPGSTPNSISRRY